ncbi:unnamed protein product [Thlaspi arvense]|uniref:Enhancer of polycomb-like protein n=1 Tax=Thlaspi arvense TaxID=13288 RepID=A0AAU9T361_THLAR|nr:unnamed protein product [Thlaspi arvense]
MGNSFGAEISGKNKSLDIQSLYKSSAPKKKGSKKRKGGAEDDGEIRKKKRKIRKEVSLSSLEAVGEKSRNTIDESCGDGLSLDLPDSGGSDSTLSQKLDVGSGLNRISHNLDNSSNVVKVPKRRRGFVGRKKCDRKEVSGPQGPFSSRISGSGNQISKLSSESGKLEDGAVSKRLKHPSGGASPGNRLSKLKADSTGELGYDDFKENKIARAGSAHKDKVENGHPVVGNDDGSSRKHLGIHSKSKDLASGSESLGKTVEHLDDSLIKKHDDLKDKQIAVVSAAQHDKVEDGHTVLDNGDMSSWKHRGTRRKKDSASGSESLGRTVEPPDDSLIKKHDDLKDNQIAQISSSHHDKVEDDHQIVDNGDVSSRKHRGTRRRKDLASGSERLGKTVEPPSDGLIRQYDDSQDEDEENLEQNAARMLSSRFDPSCTRSSKSRSSGSPSRNGLTYFMPSDEDFVSRGVNSSAGLESASGDTASRVLRPRKSYKEKGLLRKRRHFYEILSRDVDAYWVLNRRIKVFWPLDESWYYGLVNDYDPERKLHHIKYDDRDEEWVNLHNERFKLLLLRSEFHSKTDPEKATLSNNHQDNDSTKDVDDSLIGSGMESEPIISWLARASRRVGSSALGVAKRPKTSHTSTNHLPHTLPTKSDDVHGCSDIDSSERNTRNQSCHSALLDKCTDSSRVLDSNGTPKDGKLPVVYYRRRFRNRPKMLSDMLENKNVCGRGAAASTSSAPIVHCSHTSGEFDFSLEAMEPEGLLWSFDNSGLLRLTVPLGKFRQFRFLLGFTVPVFRYNFGLDNSWMLHAVLQLQYGAVINTWPKVLLEMLFVDDIFGCLKQAMAFVFMVLRVFCQPDEQRSYIDVQMPVTSIRRQHTFAFYGFSKVKYSKWLYLDGKLQRQCLLTKQLPLSECTYDNIKALGGGSNQSSTSMSCTKPALESLQEKSMQDIVPKGAIAFQEPSSVVMNQCSTSDARLGKLLPFSLSFAAAPTFFHSLHLKILMENCISSISLQDNGSMYALDHSEAGGHAISHGCSLSQECSKGLSDVTLEANPRTSLMENKSSGWSPRAKSQVATETISKCIDYPETSSSQDFPNGKFSMDGNPLSSRDTGEMASSVVTQPQNWGCNRTDSKQFVGLSQPSTKDQVFVDLPDSSHYSGLTGLSVKIPSVDQVVRPASGKTSLGAQGANLAQNMTGSSVCSPYTTGPRSMWHRNNNISTSSSGDVLPGWPDGKTDFMCSGFGNGPKKPRTQVQYTLPFEGFDFSSKQRINNQRGLPFRRIRKSSEKKTTCASKSSQRNVELLACDANVLITIGDKGWRECGARIVLELADHNEWRLAVKLAGNTKYSYKAHQFLQTGSTNRFTHAMMWKGGKDWALEFTDRSQWMLFKEMHEECYNRNARAASVKNIPIPGVHLIEEFDDAGTEVPFPRSFSKYIRQVETDVDMAMNPSHVLYDIDSDDEQWISQYQKSKNSHESCEEISEGFFEKIMDKFEKVAYVRQCDFFTADEIEEFMAGLGPIEVIKVIHEHWRLKRQKKGMPLIRHLQPPLWERYEQQVKEWETESNSMLSNGCQEKAPPVEKPPMFAFCLKPRGLEVPNKGSKQRSQRRFPVSSHSRGILVDQDVLHSFGRRSNGFGFGDEEVVFQGNGHESSDASPVFQASARAFSPRDATGSGHFSLSGDWSEWNHRPKLYRNKSRRMGTFPSPRNAQMTASYNQRTGYRNGVHQWNVRMPEWPNQKTYLPEVSMRHGIEQLDGSDIDEFRLRDASGAAQHALNMAKLKREKAQRLLYRADLAIHKAVVALMNAEAIKASHEKSNGNASNDSG